MPEAATNDFQKARVGSVAMQVCCTCGGHMSILIKSQGRHNAPAYNGPQHIAVEGESCEFCEFLGMWFNHEKITPSDTGLKYGTGKLVLATGELFAYIPFSSDTTESQLEGGVKFNWTHGMVVRVEPDGDRVRLVEIISHGV